MALGILIKGPIILILQFYLYFFIQFFRERIYLIWYGRSWDFLLFNYFNTLVYFDIYKSNGLFWHESVVNDLFNKVKSGQESHGFIPGYYSLLIFLFFWPASIFVPSFFLTMKRKFKNYFLYNKVNCYLILSFLLPFVVYELIPTKLPHYIFPHVQPYILIS